MGKDYAGSPGDFSVNTHVFKDGLCPNTNMSLKVLVYI